MRNSIAAARRLASIAALALVCALARPAAALEVGTQRLARCAGLEAYCGTLERALDPQGHLPDRIAIHFEYYPHRDAGPARGTIVAAEGGPGYPATDSRAPYLALFAPLLGDRDLLLMDNRGTGRSGAIDCPELQTAPTLTLEATGACGRDLGARAPLYGTAYATDDLAAVLAALGISAIDLYGNSYGTFFAQVFAVRHADLVRALVLDGAYPLRGADIPWYPGYAPATRDKFNRACERSPRCAALPGTSIAHIEPALARLRAKPVGANAADAEGVQQHFTANAAALAIVMFGGSPAYATVREVDAAARAYAAGDSPPLYRLMAESLATVDSRDPTRDPAKFSAGLAAAVTCQDAPQIFDMKQQPAARLRERDRALARQRAAHPASFAPFTLDEYRAMPIDYSFIDQCVRWPVPDPAHPASQVVAADASFPRIPVLVLSGDLDNMTTVADGAASAAQFPRARQVVLVNSFHVNALPHARSACGAELVRHFLATLDPGDVGCATAVAPVRLAPPFARHWVEVEPARATAGNAADAAALRAAAAAVDTAGDLLGRVQANSSGRGVGLRGGRFEVRDTPTGRHVDLTGIRWTEDLEVSGMLDWPSRTGEAVAILEFQARGGVAGRLTARWPEGGADALARLEGLIDGAALAAEMPAP